MNLLLILILSTAGARGDTRLEDSLRAFGQNVVPSPRIEGQRQAFRLYVRTYFGGTVERLDDRMMDKIMSHLEKHPEAAKTRLGGAEIIDRIHPIEDDLARFTKDLLAGQAKLKQVITNPAANVGAWRKAREGGAQIFDDEALRAFVARATSNAIAETPLGDLPAAFASWLDAANVKGTARSAILSNVVQYVALAKHDPRGPLRANDRRALLRRLDEVSRARADLATSVGTGFDVEGEGSASRVFRVDLLSAPNLRRRLDAFRAVMSDAEISDWTLRPLSEAEAALRSLLARDCATETYLERAFDPAYYYFTRTERGGYSWGHLTVVLGRAWHGAIKTRVAFVDKIQGVASDDLPREIEALRQITARAGYQLVLPETLGDNNGISNDVELRDAVAALPAYANSKTTYRRFRAERSKFAAGRVGASRAFDNLRVRPVLAHEDANVLGSITLLDPVPQTVNPDPIDVPALLNTLVAGKTGSLADRMRYIDAMQLAKKERLPVDPDFETLTDRWLKDRDEPIELRFHVATYKIAGHSGADVLNAFEQNELRTLLSGWSQSRNMRDRLRLTIWLSSPYMRGENQMLMAGAFPATISEEARGYLVRALVAPPIRDEIVALVEKHEAPLHIDLIRIFVFLEAYVSARAENSPVTAELRRVALGQARHLLPQYNNVLPPADLHYVPRAAALLARPDFHLDAPAFEEFFDEPENQPEHITFATRWTARSSNILLGSSIVANLGLLGAVYEHQNWVSYGLAATSLALGQVQRKTSTRRHLADVRVRELNYIAARFPLARNLARDLAKAVRHCQNHLTAL